MDIYLLFYSSCLKTPRGEVRSSRREFSILHNEAPQTTDVVLSEKEGY